MGFSNEDAQRWRKRGRPHGSRVSGFPDKLKARAKNIKVRRPPHEWRNNVSATRSACALSHIPGPHLHLTLYGGANLTG